MTKEEAQANLIGAKQSIENLKNREGYDPKYRAEKIAILKSRILKYQQIINESEPNIKPKPKSNLKYIAIALSAGAIAALIYLQIKELL